LLLSKEKTVLSKKQKKYILAQLQQDMVKFGEEYNFNVRKWGF
jgi:hypothetical protein